MARSPWLLSRRKRALDVLIAVSALSATLPIFLVAALMVRIIHGRPVLFRQERAGLDGRPFEVTKFRTMRDTRDGSGRPLPDDERLTRLGRALRSSSIDELPQLWSVIKGDMSIVGPRPLPVYYIDRYDATQVQRLLALPGITGLAQVRGRNAMSWEQKFAADVEYVQQAGFRTDVRIMVATVSAVFSRSGIAAEGSVTMPEFFGSGD